MKTPLKKLIAIEILFLVGTISIFSVIYFVGQHFARITDDGTQYYEIRNQYEKINLIIIFIIYPLRIVYYLVRWSLNTIKQGGNFKNKNKHNMKKYFYSNGKDKEGPVTLEELKQKDIKPKTLIWHEGLDDWKEAEVIEELKEIFELSPPPIDSENETLGTIELNNLSSENNSAATNSYPIKKQGMFSNPFSFEGRIRRTEYGLSLLIFSFGLSIVNLFLKDGYTIVSLAIIPLYWFLWAQGAKRCHDLGKNGWWQIIPLYVLLLIFSKGEIGINKYGINPKNQ